ncbi:unnamed protein product [Prunus armeniaca]|uniref:Uncharacterized protein n=1 Tax=Prunus armeniaca TaxID=36596 RepID=A0A6J5Y5D5_PRUAR|nr:unnamed protein product [Prunus armeniaca]CAB4319195.1 unnamed protein product [Prunus armeniaca]
MEERDNDEEGSRKAVGIGVQTWRWFHCKMSRFCLIEFVNNSVQTSLAMNLYADITSNVVKFALLGLLWLHVTTKA